MQTEAVRYAHRGLVRGAARPRDDSGRAGCGGGWRARGAGVHDVGLVPGAAGARGGHHLRYSASRPAAVSARHVAVVRVARRNGGAGMHVQHGRGGRAGQGDAVGGGEGGRPGVGPGVRGAASPQPGRRRRLRRVGVGFWRRGGMRAGGAACGVREAAAQGPQKDAREAPPRSRCAGGRGRQRAPGGDIGGLDSRRRGSATAARAQVRGGMEARVGAGTGACAGGGLAPAAGRRS